MALCILEKGEGSPNLFLGRTKALETRRARILRQVKKHQEDKAMGPGPPGVFYGC